MGPENIRGFGGNPFNVTVEGESAGGIDICAHFASPKSAGLFQQAIMESMYCPAAPHEEALSTSAPVAAAAGCTDTMTAAACLRAKPAAEVLQAAGPLNPIVGGETVIPGKGTGFNASPNFGNDVLPLKPIDALASGRWNWKNVLLGSNHDEAALFVGPQLVGKVKLPLDANGYDKVLQSRFGSFGPAVKIEYGADADLFHAFADEMTDDSPLGCPVSTLSQVLSTATRTYRYEFNDARAPTPSPAGSSLPSLPLGAYHGSELQYLFKMTKLPAPRLLRSSNCQNR